MPDKTDQSKTPNLATPISIIIAGIIIAGAIILTSGNLSDLLGKSNPTPNIAGVNEPSAPANPQGGTAAATTVKVSTDDDPVLGNPDAPVTIIEFSDYECPFCKRAFQQSFPKIKSEYIDKGLVKLVFRDLPLPFHDPLATKQAIAANCAREQGGDEIYFAYHDEIFNRTNSNGNGMPVEELNNIAKDLNLNISDFSTCLDSEKYLSEVQKDLSDAAAVGANGTPAFFVGKSSTDGIIEGTKISGAQPYEVFKSIIDGLLE